MPTIAERRDTFRQLHASGCFVIPNPWDLGSARLLAQLGFVALATTSSGFAWTLGRPDNGIAIEDALAHFLAIAEGTDIPVNADFQGGFAVEPAIVRENVTAVVTTGVAGLSLEDSTGDASSPLFEFALAVERGRRARAALDDTASGVLLTGRSEGFIVGRPDLRETVRRLVAYADAGADCVFAPGLRTLSDIRTVVTEVAPRPVNVLASGAFSVPQLAEVGVRRISVGSGLARAAWKGFLDAAREIATTGSFASLDRTVPFPEMNALFSSE